ncbi:hypothetical protein KQI84_14690 [bacterium]|nr:hypothetical protein [bacterium]
MAATHSGLILNAKYRMAGNALRGIRRHMYIHMFVGFGLAFVMVGGGTAFFHTLFEFLMRQEVFGPPLMDMLVGIVFLAFFSMLIFSNLIITLSTSYISREVDFLMGMPLSYQAIFRQKLVESILYSSWAFAVLSFPFFVALGVSRDVAWYFFPLVILLIVPFLIIPAASGAIITMVVTAFLPARRTRTLSLALGVIAVVLALMMAKVMGMGRILAKADEQNFLQIMGILELGTNPLLPSAWMTRGLLAIAPGDMGKPDLAEYLYWLGMLAATAMFLLELSRWLVPSLYYRGWCLSKDSANRTVASQSTWSPFRVIDQWLNVLPRQKAALISKDLKTFWRDPSQWTQLVILFGLMILYIANLKSARRYSDTVQFLLTEWKTILAFFNLGATCFILSILTTRFVYPMLSLEGRQFWTVGLAPMRRSTVVWQKYVLCVATALAFALTLMLLSNWVLQIKPFMRWLSIVTIVVMSFALSSLSIGIGAILPNFREDNPARIANGLGGTANAMLSLGYIGLTIAMIIVPVNVFDRGGWDPFLRHKIWTALYALGFLAVQLSAIGLPMYIGLKKWDKLQF